MKGIKPNKGRINLWKCVRPNGTDFRTGTIQYISKSEITCPDWQTDLEAECGNGLHLADSPSGARYFVNYDQLKTARLLRVSAKIEDCRCFPGQPNYPMKLRARACRFVKEYPIDYEGPEGVSE
jgi:hypothetical protein